MAKHWPALGCYQSRRVRAGCGRPDQSFFPKVGQHTKRRVPFCTAGRPGLQPGNYRFRAIAVDVAMLATDGSTREGRDRAADAKHAG